MLRLSFNVTLVSQMATVLSGTSLARNIQVGVRDELRSIRKTHVDFIPKLVAITVGEDPASTVYLRKKREAADFCGLLFQVGNFSSRNLLKSERCIEIHCQVLTLE